jgi:hypothetical protein
MRPNQSLEQPLAVVMVVLMLTTNGANRRFQFQKRGQLFIGVHNETLSVVAVCVRSPDGSLSNPRVTEITWVHGFFSSQSFWKAGSARKGSQSGSSLRRAGVTGVPA